LGLYKDIQWYLLQRAILTRLNGIWVFELWVHHKWDQDRSNDSPQEMK